VTVHERFTLRNMYLYLVCLITLVISIFAAVQVVRNVVELAYPSPGGYFEYRDPKLSDAERESAVPTSSATPSDGKPCSDWLGRAPHCSSLVRCTATTGARCNERCGPERRNRRAVSRRLPDSAQAARYLGRPVGEHDVGTRAPDVPVYRKGRELVGHDAHDRWATPPPADEERRAAKQVASISASRLALCPGPC